MTQSREPVEGETIHAAWSDRRLPRSERDRQGGVMVGIILILLGLLFLISQLVPRLDKLILLALGLGFYIAYFATERRRGFLIAGGVLGGLGLGIVSKDVLLLGGPAGTAVIFGPWAVGWASIYLIDRAMTWPLWPAGLFALITAVAGISSIPGLDDLSRFIWPLILILLGAWLLMRRQRAF